MEDGTDLTGNYVGYLFKLANNFTARSLSINTESGSVNDDDQQPFDGRQMAPDIGDEDRMEFVDFTVDGRFAAVVDDASSGISNMTQTSSVFNFSSDTAAKVIDDYLAGMRTIDQPPTIALLCLYVPVFLFSLAGNSFVIALFVKDRRMRRSKSLFLVNLALADEAVTVVCIPLFVSQTVNRLWIYGDLLCKVAGFMQGQFYL
jgi:hypothetical protein